MYINTISLIYDRNPVYITVNKRRNVRTHIVTFVYERLAWND